MVFSNVSWVTGINGYGLAIMKGGFGQAKSKGILEPEWR